MPMEAMEMQAVPVELMEHGLKMKTTKPHPPEREGTEQARAARRNQKLATRSKSRVICPMTISKVTLAQSSLGKTAA